jgi:hypothetical protein
MCGGLAAGGKGEAAIVEKLTFSDTATWRNKAGILVQISSAVLIAAGKKKAESL